MAKYKRRRNLSDWKSNRPQSGVGKLRIVGGKFRGRQIEYSGDPLTRPMKDNIREALFNLVGGWVENKAVFDLFAGTGAIGIEALSRGASKAILIERHFPTVRIINQNVQSLGLEEQTDVFSSDTFFWVRQFLNQQHPAPSEPWVVFCCPPYQFFVDRPDDVLTMIQNLMDVAPEGSIFVVESDERFDPKLLPQSEAWMVREYSPAIVSVFRERIDSEDESEL